VPTATDTEQSRHRISRLLLEEPGGIRLSPQLEHERRSALFDLLEDNRFVLLKGRPGPYTVRLGIEGGQRLVFAVYDEADRPVITFMLPTAELRRIIKDYFLLCDSYFQAIRTMTPSRIEAIDMGRRGLHNEGAELLRERLSEYVELDLNTARRLFTLICVLHIRK
jgi:uncharacterized protein (UPF0262 family)